MTTVLANPNQVAWTYTDERSGTHRVRAKYAIVAQLLDTDPVVGGSAAEADVPQLVRGLTPRYVIVAGDVTNKIRRVTCYSTLAPLWIGAVNQVTLLINGVDEVCTVTGWVGEVMHGGIADSTHQ